MSAAARERLALLLAQTIGYGAFSASRTAPPDDLLIEVRGVGALELPISGAQARALLDERGTGDSMFAATGVGLARGLGVVDALRLGAAAGALNATRRGLGTGTRQEIERLAAHVTVHPIEAVGDNDATASA
jgi:1-phosphofructokinase